MKVIITILDNLQVLLRKVRGWKPLLHTGRMHFSWFQGVPWGHEQLLLKEAPRYTRPVIPASFRGESGIFLTYPHLFLFRHIRRVDLRPRASITRYPAALSTSGPIHALRQTWHIGQDNTAPYEICLRQNGGLTTKLPQMRYPISRRKAKVKVESDQLERQIHGCPRIFYIRKKVTQRLHLNRAF